MPSFSSFRRLLKLSNIAKFGNGTSSRAYLFYLSNLYKQLLPNLPHAYERSTRPVPTFSSRFISELPPFEASVPEISVEDAAKDLKVAQELEQPIFWIDVREPYVVQMYFLIFT